MRGYGLPQMAFVVESLIDVLANHLGIDPITIRKLNGLEGNQTTATGQVLGHDVGYKAALQALERHWVQPLSKEGAPRVRRGRGVASMWYGIGRTNSPNICQAEIVLTGEGRFVVYVGATEIGQGCTTVLGQIAARALHQTMEQVTVVTGDSLLTPDADSTTAGRQTYMSGFALVGVARLLEQELLERASRILGIGVEELTLVDGAVVGRADENAR